jgi:AGZA family xanthine/uracil permease-like MFS transporter
LANISPAVAPLAQGALLTAMLWGAVAVFVIDRLWTRAAVAAASLALCAAVGLIHAPRLAWLPEQGREFVYGYLILALMLVALSFVALGPDQQD